MHGLPISVSPIKRSKKDEAVKYFDCEIADEKKTMRMVSFDTSLHRHSKKLRKTSVLFLCRNAR